MWSLGVKSGCHRDRPRVRSVLGTVALSLLERWTSMSSAEGWEGHALWRTLGTAEGDSSRSLGWWSWMLALPGWNSAPDFLPHLSHTHKNRLGAIHAPTQGVGAG